MVKRGLGPDTALRQRSGRRAVGVAACFLLLAASSAIGYGVLLRQPESGYAATQPPSTAFFDWVRHNTPPGALFITRNPRAMVFFTGRGAVDYHLARVDPAFLDWAHALHADYLVLTVNLDEVQALAQQRGLNQALDEFEAWFLGSYRDRFPLVFRNEWFRIYRLAP